MQAVTAFLILGTIASLVAWVVLLLLEHGIRPVHSMVHFVRGMPWSGRLAVLPLFIALVVVGSTKFSGNSGSDGGNLQMTNVVEGVVGGGVAGGVQNAPATNPESDKLNGEQPSMGATVDEGGRGEVAGTVTQIQLPVNDGVIEVPDSITALDCEAGFVLSGVGYGEVFDFALPNDAVVCDDWLRFGAHEDWFHLPLGWFSFPFGSNVVNALTVLSSGSLYPAITNASTFIAPLKASLGIVPMANWGVLPNNSNSCFWHCFTPSNTVVFTWQNVLLERDADKPVSFQCEISQNGDMMFRYDLSNLTENPTTNVLVGLSNGRYERLYSALSNSITSLKWSHLDSNDYLIPDRDGDGLSTADEIFVYRTDPGNPDTDMDGLSDGEEISVGSAPAGRDSDGDGLVDGSDPDPAVPTSIADIDGDGIPDAYENHWFGGTNAFNSGIDRDETGFALSEKILAGINPTNAPSAVHVGNANSLVSWRLFDGFMLASPQGATNIIWERTFSVNRSSAWQQFFISSSSDSAAHWNLKGMVLEWETNEGAVGSVASSPMGDSFRIPLATNECPAAITLRLRSKGAEFLQMPQPLFFIAYAPVFKIEGGETIEGKSGKRFSLFKGGVGSSISLTVDHSLRPCNAPLSEDEKDVASLYAISEMNEEFEFSGDDSGGKITPKRPGTCDLPDFTVGGLPTQQTFNARAKGSRSGGSETTIIVIDPSAGWRCDGHGYGYDGMGYDWADDYYYEEDSYPLDSSCLRRSWSRGYEGGWNHECCEVWVSSGMGGDYGYVTSSVEGDTGKLFVDGIEVWSSTPEHTYGGDEGSFGGSSEYELGDGCNSCETDCANGNCDSLEGASLGSFKFRIPLGSPVKGQVSGFVWIASDEPIHIYREMFNVISHPDASIEETDAGGVRRIVSHDLRGRDVRIEDISNGVKITICETQSQKLEHTWEILNVDGNPEQVRLRKISRLDNVMSDETYTYRSGDWVKFDNIAQIETELSIVDDFRNYGDGVKIETRTTRDVFGNALQSVTTWQARVGDFDNAVMREVLRDESTGRNSKWVEADYWNDPAHSGRHGKPRLVRGNARAWVYTDFDEKGHETLRVEQRGNGEMPWDNFPYVVSNVLCNVSPLENAFVTVKDYAPFTLDDCHKDDAAKPRQETRYVVVNGTVTVIGRTWTCYTRLARNGYAAIRKETWRAAAPDAQLNDPSNAYSYEITYAETGVGTPLLMRGAVAESMDENGVLTENTYSLSDSILAQVSRKSFDGTFNQTYTVTEKDATYGTVLRRRECLSSDDTVVAEEVSSYDEKNRLRSTTYFDGTFITNAYSCCRLLWRQDREGRKVLRSAKTGTDHLYNAEEDVWLGDISANGQYRITQHFFDAIGRETNTVVYAGSAPGEAVEASASDGKVHSCETTEYPYGGDDYAVHTDERGKVTVSRTDILPDSIESADSVFTNGVEVVKTKSRTYFGGGSSMRREWNGDKWTEERRFTDYAADGKRIDYVVTESSDNGVVTNSVSTYDLLGRLVAQETALGTVTYHYDEASPRMTGQTTVAGDIARESAFIYDDHAEQVGVLRDGVTTRTDTTYETDSSNIVWRVTAERTFGESTNACIITKERLTGLCNECRSSVLKSDLSGAWMRIDKSFDEALGLETEKTESSSAETVSAIKKNGLMIRTLADSESAFNAYDALGRVVSTSRKTGEGDALPYQSFDYAVSGDLLATHTYTNTADIITEAYAYDMLGNRVETTDALGNTVFRSYDPFGNITAEWGATYPVRYTYDTQNRRTSLATTRDGTTWDVTRWMYDASTGLCTSKIFADGSVTIYTYTPDGLLLRETKSDGVWKEYIYDEKRQVVGVVSSDGKQDAIIERDEFGRVVSESNIAASSLYSLDNQFGATNQMDNVDGVSASFVREFDQNGRLVRFARVGGESAQYVYAAQGSISVVSNNDVTAHYSFTEDLLTAGYRIDIQDGGNFMRENYRDAFCRDNILAVTNRHGGTIRGMTYSYDALQRPILRNDDEFNYNERGEIVFSRRDAENAENIYLYDGIGNLNSYEIVGVGTNSFSVNNRNQYLTIYENSAFFASLREINLKYDSNGNLTKFGDWSYVYDSGSRLVSVSSNNMVVATFAYDTQGRRVKKVAADETHRYFYDGQLLVYEHITRSDNTVSEIDYVWGNDISGARDSACGIGGLLYLRRNGSIYIPFFDAYGNVLGYTDAQGNVVAEYTYDAFGKIVDKSGAMADDFAFRFSTKYYDAESALYYYTYRYYMPQLMRWLTEDPIAENGGLNLYGFCGNNPVCRYDKDGRAYFAVRRLKIFSINIPMGNVYSQGGGFMDRHNIQILHEQLFFQDGNVPISVGFGAQDVNGESFDGYVATQGGYNDCVMRKATEKVKFSGHDYAAFWLMGHIKKCNCQDYCSALRNKYEELIKDKKIRCECGLK